jgi:hypothetical protein
MQEPSASRPPCSGARCARQADPATARPYGKQGGTSTKEVTRSTCGWSAADIRRPAVHRPAAFVSLVASVPSSPSEPGLGPCSGSSSGVRRGIRTAVPKHSSNISSSERAAAVSGITGAGGPGFARWVRGPGTEQQAVRFVLWPDGREPERAMNASSFNQDDTKAGHGSAVSAHVRDKVLL